ncbi:MAG: SPOR domain-containing protein [Bacteroides sp.]|nr:SPOR domain-containing protein [Prevotella sp.]MCM1408044.1 SPOR domain-containing protein [Treponema brennaborense]MCM1469020.1 SPOR domain-containing protein [Bacteroides sp.]
MDQKRILWIVASVGIFLLVVIGAALILYAPVRNSDPVLASLQTNKPYRAENGQIIPAAANAFKPQSESNSSINASPQNGSPMSAKDITVIAENATVYSDKSIYAAGSAEPALTERNAAREEENAVPALQNQNQYAASVQQPQQQTAPAQIQIQVQPPNAVSEQVPPSVAQTKPVDVPVSAKSAAPARVSAAVVSSKPAAASAKPAAAAPAKKTSAPAPAKPAAHYWVQAASFNNKKNAEEARSILAEEKIRSEIFTYTDDGGKMFYRVRVGPYITKNEAEFWKSKICMIDRFSTASSYVTNTSEPAAKK